MSAPLDQLQVRLGYTFRDASLLQIAVTHTSFLPENPALESNERLEFLGDAVLQILLAEALFLAFPRDREGVLSKRRSQLVNRVFLAGLTREIGADSCLLLGKSEASTGGRDRLSLLGDAFEAIVGAIYLDSDFPTVRRIVLAIYGDITARLGTTEEEHNPKGRLQELVQPAHGNHALRYVVTGMEGEDHARIYHVEVLLNDILLGLGHGSSKKTAEEAAARVALAKLAEAPPS